MSLPGKRPTAELLYENLTSILNSFDICALPRVMFAPVLLLFYCQTDNTDTISIMVHKKKSMHKVFTTSYFSVKQNKILVCNEEDGVPFGLILTCGFAVGFLAVGTVIYVDIWCVILINPNTAGTTQGKL